MENLEERFFNLYQGLARAHGLYLPGELDDQKNKVGGKAVTILEELTPRKWKEHLDGTKGVGVVPIRDDNTCVWGAIDIDQYSGLELSSLEKKIKKLELPLVVLRTKSGGAHCTLFMAESTPAKLVRSKLMEWAVALGFPGVEVFPKQVSLASDKDVGNWLNMPYFEHELTTRYAIKNGKVLTAEQFLDYAGSMRVTAEYLEAFQVHTDAFFEDGPPCLQALAQGGFPEGGRNNGLFAVAVYLRLKHDDQWRDHLEKYNHDLMVPPLKAREVTEIEKSASRKTYFYPCTKHPLIGACNKELCRKRQFGIGEGQPDELNVQLGKLVKLLTEPPLWIIDVEGQRIELDTEDLLSQNRFNAICVAKLNTWPALVKPRTWKAIIDDKLANVEEVEAPEDAGPEGSLRFHLEQFCSSIAQARVQDEILLGKPWTDKSVTYFRSNDFFRYLDNQHFKEMTRKKIWAVLRRIGARHTQFQIKGKCVQCWSIPEFVRQEEGFDVLPTPDSGF